MTATLQEKFAFSLEYAIILPYINGDIATTPQVIQKFEITQA
jgi:hypothetical protein